MYVRYIPSLFLSQLSPWYWGTYIKDFVWKTLIYLGAHFLVVWVTKAKYQIKLKKIKTLILAYKPVQFVFLTDSVITLSAKLLNSWPWMQTQQLSVGVITGFFEKQTSLPGSNKLSCSPFSSNFWVCWLTLLAYTFKWNSLTEIFGNAVFFVFWGLPTPPPKKNMKYKINSFCFLSKRSNIYRQKWCSSCFECDIFLSTLYKYTFLVDGTCKNTLLLVIFYNLHCNGMF